MIEKRGCSKQTTATSKHLDICPRNCCSACSRPETAFDDGTCDLVPETNGRTRTVCPDLLWHMCDLMSLWMPQVNSAKCRPGLGLALQNYFMRFRHFYRWAPAICKSGFYRADSRLLVQCAASCWPRVTSVTNFINFPGCSDQVAGPLRISSLAPGRYGMVIRVAGPTL
ncbi:hypothetical protein OE88DRAFT_1154607 [Heliocybe sulcata]|uniref:Uncharacterized protein n=1 Tax=Heliocybe sulcata TaxID=5364 RepID=A0A5C3NCK6_9AGAM|nr:hypothetical protein OE88DRAFT_1154607 [Heliocybe sulcata]